MGKGRIVAGVVVLVAGLAWSLAGAPAAGACSCAPGPPEDERFAQAKVVLVGVAVSARHHEEWVLEHQVDVEVFLKGSAEDPLTVRRDQTSSCGFPLQVGERYKLYPYRQHGGWWELHVCSFNRRATEADLAGGTPSPGTSAVPATTTTAAGGEAEAPTASTSAPASTDAVSTTVAATPPADEGAAGLVRLEEVGDDTGTPVPALAAGGAALAAVAGAGAALAVRRRRTAGRRSPASDA